MFFAPLPEPDEGEHVSFEPPEWVQPPWGVLPGLVPLTRMLGRSDNAALVLRGIEAYPQGVRFLLRAVIARQGLEHRAWRHLTEDLMGPGVGASPSDALRLGISYPDGARIEVGNPWPLPEEAPDGAVLTMLGGGGGGGADRYEFSYDAWLWPFPAPGTLTLHYRWTALGIAEGALELDAAPLLAARAQAQPLWP
jgi:hypothetical protein